ncbi:Dioxygenase [Maioricimonas rarisocia]|uniref:Dioxygenase n=1 Tax=Maioricimonas rarisocia TaxID=2528026 RepID=A0A517Z176_9PLAN|nr:hypothetical protein [Maioricimonas rarisocia]QDU36223.1 Dioxygenase [Maioricimonas rarisocia]
MTRTRLTLTDAVSVFLLLCAAFLCVGNHSVSAESSHELAGRVVDEDGAPVANALVTGRLTYDEPIRELGQTDEEGRFRVQLDESASPDHVRLFVRAEGFGLADARGEEFDASNSENSDATLTLPRAVPIRGQLVDTAGHPAAGVRVRPYRVLRFGEDRRSPLAEAAADVEWVRELERKGRTVVYVDRSSELLLPWVETDAEGRFVIDSVGPDCLVGLMALGTRVEATTILVRSDDGEGFNIGYQRGEPELTVHPHSNIRQTVQPSVPLMGKVVEAETGQPVPSVTVSPWRGPGFSFFRAERLIASTTDANGDYALPGLPIGESRIFAAPPEDIWMVAVERQPNLADEDLLTRTDFKMPRGVTVTGRVTDMTTGKPVAGRIEAYVFVDNPHLESLKPSSLSTDRHTATVDDNGRFAIQVLPGPGILGFLASEGDEYRRGSGWDTIEHHRYREEERHSMFRTEPTYVTAWNHHLVVEIDPPADAETHTIDLVVGEKTIEVPLEFVRPSGGPSQVYYSNETSDNGPFSLVKFDFGQQQLGPGTIRFFEEEPGRVTQARSRDYKWAGWTWVEPTDKKARIELVESSTVRGRVVDAAGRPVAEAALRTPYLYDPTQKQAQFPSQPDDGYYPHTDDEGRFELVGLPADLPLTVEISIRDFAANRILDKRILLNDVELEVGETRDLGDIRFDELDRPDRE